MTDLVQNAHSSSGEPSQIPPMSVTPFSRDIHKALDFAAFEFRHQNRKDPDKTIPAISHFAAVAYILAQHGYPEEVVVAGILHDYLEDVVQTPFGDRRSCRRRLQNEFREEVVHLVEFVTQKKYGPGWRKRTWALRNQDYLEVLAKPETPIGALAISCADKIHNIRSLLYALQRNQHRQHRVWDALKKNPQAQLENFEAHYSMMKQKLKHPIVDDLGRQIEELRHWVPTQGGDRRG